MAMCADWARPCCSALPWSCRMSQNNQNNHYTCLAHACAVISFNDARPFKACLETFNAYNFCSRPQIARIPSVNFLKIIFSLLPKNFNSLFKVLNVVAFWEWRLTKMSQKMTLSPFFKSNLGLLAFFSCNSPLWVKMHDWFAFSQYSKWPFCRELCM